MGVVKKKITFPFNLNSVEERSKLPMDFIAQYWDKTNATFFGYIQASGHIVHLVSLL